MLYIFVKMQWMLIVEANANVFVSKLSAAVDLLKKQKASSTLAKIKKKY